MNNHLDDHIITHNGKTYNFAQLFNEKNDWRLISRECTKINHFICICKHHIKRVNFIYNKKTQICLAIGVTCYKKYGFHNILLENDILRTVIKKQINMGLYSINEYNFINFEKPLITYIIHYIDNQYNHYTQLYNSYHDLYIHKEAFYDNYCKLTKVLDSAIDIVQNYNFSNSINDQIIHDINNLLNEYTKRWNTFQYTDPPVDPPADPPVDPLADPLADPPTVPPTDSIPQLDFIINNTNDYKVISAIYTIISNLITDLDNDQIKINIEHTTKTNCNTKYQQNIIIYNQQNINNSNNTTTHPSKPYNALNDFQTRSIQTHYDKIMHIIESARELNQISKKLLNSLNNDK